MRIHGLMLAYMVLGLGCSPAVPTVGPSPRREVRIALPAYVVATSRTVITADGHPDVRLGFPRPELALTVLGPVGDGRAVRVRVAGGIELTGVMARDALGVLVCEPGPLGERYYLGSGSLLSLRSGVENGHVTVAGAVLLRQRNRAPGQRFDQEFGSQRFTAPIAVQRLCAAAPRPRHAGTGADPRVARIVGEVDLEDFPAGTELIDIPKDTEVALLDRPGGAPVYTRPADPWGYALARIRHQGDWDLVAAGSGPYVLGWIRARLPRPRTAGGLGILGGLMGSAPPGPSGLHTQALRGLELHTLPAGTLLQQFGKPVARLTRAGYARVSTARDGWIFVVVAVDEDLVVEGWIRPRQLGPKVE